MPGAAMAMIGLLGLIIWFTSPVLLGLTGLLSALTDSPPTVEILPPENAVENSIDENGSSTPVDAPAGEPAIERPVRR